MAAISHSRGHKIIYIGRTWVYVDGLTDIDTARPCIRCGKPPTKEGYDTCLGLVDGTSSACCGHGIVRGWKVCCSVDAPCERHMAEESQDGPA